MPLKLPKTHRNHFETHIVYYSHVVKCLLRLEMVLDEMYFLINNTLPTTFCSEYVSEPYLEVITVDAKDQRIDIEKKITVRTRYVYLKRFPRVDVVKRQVNMCAAILWRQQFIFR